MKRSFLIGVAKSALVTSALVCASAHAGFDSGSTGADGAFNPATNVTLQVPPSGKFNFTTVNIPNGVVVTFARNARNTPVYILATGDVVVDGTIDVHGGSGSTNPDPTYPGRGAPGGYDGGPGGRVPSFPGGDGLGPGAGRGGTDDGTKTLGGGGAGHRVAGDNAGLYVAGIPGQGGGTYGTPWMTPLVGGSGGGGGAGGNALTDFGINGGGGGGGGGGAILIASSGTISGGGFIHAFGGSGGYGVFAAGSAPNRCSGGGGGGSGGAVHLLAAGLGSGPLLEVSGGNGGVGNCSSGGYGRPGYVKREALLAGVLVINPPSLLITKVAGIAVPANVTGFSDVTIPTSTPNPVTVEVSASGIPVGSALSVTVAPSAGNGTTVTGTSLAGSVASSTATAQVNVPNGASSIWAAVNYAVPVALGESLTRYAGEPVKSIKLTNTLNGPSKTMAVTESGREVEVPAGLLTQIALLPN